MKKQIRPESHPWANATGDGRWNKTRCSCGADKHIRAEVGRWSKTRCSCGAEKLICLETRSRTGARGFGGSR
jgi:hypothetical protein